jgi:hypothetical protein
MTRSPKVTNRLVKLRDACAALACSRRSFWERWHGTFSDPRPAEDRRPGCERKVFEDELSVAIESGRAAVLTLRKRLGRI